MDKTKDQPDWLAELDAQSRARQSSFIDGISQKLGRARPKTPPVHPFRGAPDFWKSMDWPLEERIARFMENFQETGGHAAHLPDWADVRQFIAERAAEMGAKSIIRQHQPELEQLQLEQALPPDVKVTVWNQDTDGDNIARAAEADIGVVAVDYAIAYTGSLTVMSSGGKGRSVSLLPPVLFAIIPVWRLRTRLGEVLAEFDQAGREHLPAGIHFISGPSRSADIENDLTIGVHGPGIVYALIVG
jgi:L-lactate dehydrogenase complex protein LldG